jgi:hypothetical protein
MRISIRPRKQNPPAAELPRGFEILSERNAFSLFFGGTAPAGNAQERKTAAKQAHAQRFRNRSRKTFQSRCSQDGRRAIVFCVEQGDSVGPDRKNAGLCTFAGLERVAADLASVACCIYLDRGAIIVIEGERERRGYGVGCGDPDERCIGIAERAHGQGQLGRAEMRRDR